MLYLAEIKRLNRSLIGSSRAELRLLAFQRGDQTWSSVPGEEVIGCETSSQLGEGAMVMVELNNARQVQGLPEPAGAALVRLLQNFSRQLSKSKDQEDEISNWKQSLAFQGEELTKRETELESRFEQLERLEVEYRRMQEQQANLALICQEFGLSSNEDGSEGEQLEHLAKQLGIVVSAGQSLRQNISNTTTILNEQDAILSAHWDRLAEFKQTLTEQLGVVETHEQYLLEKQSYARSSQSELKKAIQQLQEQSILLGSKRELGNWLGVYVQEMTEVRNRVDNLIHYTGRSDITLQELESIPIEELAEMIDSLKHELEKFMRFVSDQEEELLLQRQTVDELVSKINASDDYSRLQLESELADEQERRRMLDETLVGQRRNLQERQEVLRQHNQILRRRQGIQGSEVGNNPVDLQGIVKCLTEQLNHVQHQQRKLESEIEQLQQHLPSIHEQVSQLEREQEERERELIQQMDANRTERLRLAQLEAKVVVYEQCLEPLTGSLQQIREQFSQFDPLLSETTSETSNYPTEEVSSELANPFG